MTVIPPPSSAPQPQHRCELPGLMSNGTLWKCSECGRWWFSRCSAMTNYEMGWWAEVRWYHRYFKKRIMEHQNGGTE